MTTQKNKFNWMKLAEKGKIEEEIKLSLDKLKNELLDKLQTEIEPNFSKTIHLSNETRLLIENQLDRIFSSYGVYSEKEKRKNTQKFCQNLEKSLDLIISKKACCSIEFNGYNIFTFYKALSSLLDEVEIQIQKNRIYILTMDPLRIAIIEVILSNDSFVFYQDEKIGFNLADLQNALKCKNTDKSKIKLIFGKEKLYITIKSQKFKSQIERALDTIDFHQSGNIDINQLNEFDYSCKFSLSKEKMEYLIENFGMYSEILEIRCSKDKISFLESGESGKNEISWGKNYISDITLNLEKIKQATDENKAIVKEMFSLDFFKMIYKMATILNKNDGIFFSIRENYPLKAEILYPHFDNTIIIFYISPRK